MDVIPFVWAAVFEQPLSQSCLSVLLYIYFYQERKDCGHQQWQSPAQTMQPRMRGRHPHGGTLPGPITGSRPITGVLQPKPILTPRPASAILPPMPDLIPELAIVHTVPDGTNELQVLKPLIQRYGANGLGKLLYWLTRGCCWYCGVILHPGTETFDHVVPRVKGGRRHPINLVPACQFCNSAKGKRSVEEYRAYLNRFQRVQEGYRVVFWGETVGLQLPLLFNFKHEDW